MSSTATAVSGRDFRVYPEPQEMNLSDQTVSLANAVIVLADSQSRAAAELLSRWIADEFLVNLAIAVAAPAGVVPITLSISGGKDVPDKPEGYALSITSRGVIASGHDSQGLLYAVATIVQLLQLSAGKLILPVGTVRDWPYRPIRYVHLYIPGRNYIPFFKRYVREFLLRYKFNGIVLEVGGGARLTRHPEIATGWKRTVMALQGHGDQIYKTGESCPLGPDNRFQDTTHHGIADGGWIEPDDLRDVVAFARAHGQEVVPEIQSLTHVYHLACAHRDIAELPDALFPDAYCPSNENSYKLLFEVMDEYIDIMSARTVHIGHDEWRAGGLCPKCREKHTGDLFAQDVIRIYQHLSAKGVNVWMWGDHLISAHNETGRSQQKGGAVWYDYPTTKGAWQQIKKACPGLVLLNWSWSIKPGGVTAQGQCDQELLDKGFSFLYGNFSGAGFENWPERSARESVLGAEISSWCTMNEFQIGKMHIAMALGSINLLWSTHWPDRADAARRVIELLPAVSRRLKDTFQPPIRLVPRRQKALDLSSLFNSPLKAGAFDLSGLRKGNFSVSGLDCRLGNGAILISRAHKKTAAPVQVTIPLSGNFAALVFLQTSTGQPRDTVHAGDGTFFANESSELIGLYDIVFRDGLVLPADIRAGENVGHWDAGFKSILYHARNIEAGTLPNGDPLLIWGLEWTNPRPDAEIAEIRFHGSNGPSDAQPLLLGITTIEKDRLSDYRR